jgi:hypothetical protein
VKAKPVGRLDSALDQVARAASSRGAAAAREFAGSLKLRVEGDEVFVVVETGRVTEKDARVAVAAASGRVVSSYHGLLLARVPIRQLARLSVSPSVRLVRRPARPTPAVVSEGVGEINASVWQAAGVNGTGVKVGIID